MRFNINQEENPDASIFKYAIYFAGPSKKSSSMPKRLLAKLSANAPNSLSSRTSSRSDVSSITDESNSDVSDSEIDWNSVVYFEESLVGYEEYVVFYEEEVTTTSDCPSDARESDDESGTKVCTNCSTPEESDDDACDSGNSTMRSSNPSRGGARKTVTFNPSPEIRVMRTWPFAHLQARINPHRFSYVEEVRFYERIKNTETILLPILDCSHRDAIFAERFREQN